MIKRYLQIIFILIPTIIVSCGLANSKNQGELADPDISIGTKEYIWEDANRLDIYYGDTRKINVRIWYPAENINNEKNRTPYLLFADRLYQKLEGWSESDINTAKKIITGSFADAPVLEKINKMPLLIFSPSLGGNLSYYTYYAEYFAKKGFIVMGINHLHESEAIVGNDSNVYLVNHSFHDSLKSLKIPEEISADRYREVQGIRQKILAEDIVFALNQLLSDPVLGIKIDKNKIGVFGHSIGGAAGVYSSIIDKRIKTVINLDGTPPTIALNNGIDVPFLFIEDLTDYRNHEGYAKVHKRRSDFCDLNRADSWRILIKGFNHNSFLDVNYYFGENPRTIKTVQNDLDRVLNFMNSFLNYYLLDKSKLDLEPSVSDQLEILVFKK